MSVMAVGALVAVVMRIVMVMRIVVVMSVVMSVVMVTIRSKGSVRIVAVVVRKHINYL